MIKHYYVSDDLDELEMVEKDLESAGIKESHIHVLSNSAADVEKHHLHMVNSFQQQDIVHSTEVGAIVGVVGSILVLLLAHFLGWADTTVGWLPFIFLSIVILGFCTWEGGLIGIQKRNINFVPFQKLIDQGKHILLVDSNKQSEMTIYNVIAAYPNLRFIGTSSSSWGTKFKVNLETS